MTPPEEDQSQSQIEPHFCAIELMCRLHQGRHLGNFAQHIIKASALKSQADVQREITRAKEYPRPVFARAATISWRRAKFISMGLTEDQSHAHGFGRAVRAQSLGRSTTKRPYGQPGPSGHHPAH